MRALEHITILDLTHMLSGPYGTMLLADLGARTIKVEPPGKGEGTRRLLENDPNYSKNEMGAYILTLGRNKESIAIDLKSEAGLEIFYKLVKRADVVVSNFGFGVTERLKIDYRRLSEINPKIVTATITGFGETGPSPKRPAFDLVAQGTGGGMSITGRPGNPLRAGIPIGDLGGGLFCAIGILTALQAREVTGRGQHVDVSMADCQVSMLNYMATMYLMSGQQTQPNANGHFVHVPYNSFRTQTRHIIIAVITDKFWKSLVELLGDPELDKPAFDNQPGRLAKKEFIEARVQAVLETKPCEYWLERLRDAKIPAGPVNDFEHVFSDPQILARNMRVKVELEDGTQVEQPGNPIKLSETYEDIFQSPPRVGEHTERILQEFLGIETEQARSSASDESVR